VCLKFVKFHRLIFVLSGLGNSNEFAKSSPSRRNFCIHSGSLFCLENCSTYSLSKGILVTVVIELSLLTFTHYLFRLQYLIHLYSIHSLQLLICQLILLHPI